MSDNQEQLRAEIDPIIQELEKKGVTFNMKEGEYTG